MLLKKLTSFAEIAKHTSQKMREIAAIAVELEALPRETNSSIISFEQLNKRYENTLRCRTRCSTELHLHQNASFTKSSRLYLCLCERDVSRSVHIWYSVYNEE